jgi:hypothetical protein
MASDDESSREEVARIREGLAALREEFRVANVEAHEALVALDFRRLREIGDQEHALIDRFKALVDSAITGIPTDPKSA